MVYKKQKCFSYPRVFLCVLQKLENEMDENENCNVLKREVEKSPTLKNSEGLELNTEHYTSL